MRSTQQLIANPFHHGEGNRQERLMKLETKRGKKLDLPDYYCDAHTGDLMDNPANIKLKETASDYYVEFHSTKRLVTHPISRQEDWHIAKPPAIDTALSANIESMLIIEELKQYLEELEAARLVGVLESLQTTPEYHVKALLSHTTSDIMEAYQLKDEDMPDSSFSALTKKVMTIPVIIDKTFTIDFFELLFSQPHYLPKGEAMLKLQKQFDNFLDHKAYLIETEKKHHLRMIDTLSAESLTKEQAEQEKRKCETQYNAKMSDMKALTLQWFIEYFGESDPIVYINPFTRQPLQSIAINYAVLKEIDRALDPYHRELRMVVEQVATHEDKDNPTLFSQQLLDAEFPQEKIPESLQQGRIPGQDRLEIMTHPILLDGEYHIDYARLKQYWDNNHFFSFLFHRRLDGINPFTGLPIKTIRYDIELKSSTDHFMMNKASYLIILTDREVKNGSFLRNRALFTHAIYQKKTDQVVMEKAFPR